MDEKTNTLLKSKLEKIKKAESVINQKQKLIDNYKKDIARIEQKTFKDFAVNLAKNLNEANLNFFKLDVNKVSEAIIKDYQSFIIEEYEESEEMKSDTKEENPADEKPQEVEQLELEEEIDM